MTNKNKKNKKTNFFKDFLSQPEENSPFFSPIIWAKKNFEKHLTLPKEYISFQYDCHLVIIDYRSEEGCIIGYITFFGIGYIALIDDQYKGDTFVKSYYINVKERTRNEFECEYQLNITQEVLAKLIEKGLTLESLETFEVQYSQAFEDSVLSKDIEDIFFSLKEEMGLEEEDSANEEFFQRFYSKFMNSNYIKNKLSHRSEHDIEKKPKK